MPSQRQWEEFRAESVGHLLRHYFPLCNGPAQSERCKSANVHHLPVCQASRSGLAGGSDSESLRGSQAQWGLQSSQGLNGIEFGFKQTHCYWQASGGPPPITRTEPMAGLSSSRHGPLHQSPERPYVTCTACPLADGFLQNQEGERDTGGPAIPAAVSISSGHPATPEELHLLETVSVQPTYKGRGIGTSLE